jgi:CCR4-NOT transcription complex subunit 7/8
VVFHGCFDFGYFLRALRSEPLPKTAEEFYKSVKIYFPNIYDVKKIIGEEE